MEVHPYINTIRGEVPITRHIPIKIGEQLRIILTPTHPTDIDAKYVEVLDPLERVHVHTNLPLTDLQKLTTIDVPVTNNWLSGYYIVNVLDKRMKILCSCCFPVKTVQTDSQVEQKKTTNPIWRIIYTITVLNPTAKPIGNFTSFIALPVTISPQQIVRSLELSPDEQKISTDVEGNHWTRYDIPRIDSGKRRTFGYTAFIEMSPMVIPRHNFDVTTSNPYSEKFLEKYLRSEPHIESDHPEIMELAKTIKNRNPLKFARNAINTVNNRLKYEIQPDEYGAAFAIEKGKGDCTEYSALFVALCRATGIPARVVAGFTHAQNWERHATAEFLVAGRWIPVDVTGYRDSTILFGSLPSNIIITRGNWMGGTLAKEVSYKYQVIEPNQNLSVDIFWNITLENKANIGNGMQQVTKKVKIISPKIVDYSKIITKAVATSKVKILDEVEGSKDEIVKLIKNSKIKLESKGNIKKDFELEISLPDIVRKGTNTRPNIVMKNNLDQRIKGCLEIRQINNGIIKLRSINGLVFDSLTERKLKPKIFLDFPGTNYLEFVFMNRIGRVLGRTETNVSLF
ncbi:MAG: transglutaminase-like domain-containing protein [Candidatus Heimdallarchaeota archaeon]